MTNAIYKGKIYSASIYQDKAPDSVMIRSKYKQEEDGFAAISDNRGYYKYVNLKDIQEYYSFSFYAVFGDARCFIISIYDDMQKMAFEECGRTLKERYKYDSEIDRGCYLYSNIPVKDANSFLLKIKYLQIPDFETWGEEKEITLSYDEFVEKYQSMVCDVF